MVEVMKIMVTSFRRSHAGTVALSVLSLEQATTDPRLPQGLLDTHRQVWLSLLLGHCSFLLGSCAHKVLFVPSKSVFPVLWKFCNQIPLASKVKLSGGCQSLCQIPGWEICCGFWKFLNSTRISLV